MDVSNKRKNVFPGLFVVMSTIGNHWLSDTVLGCKNAALLITFAVFSLLPQWWQHHAFSVILLSLNQTATVINFHLFLSLWGQHASCSTASCRLHKLQWQCGNFKFRINGNTINHSKNECKLEKLVRQWSPSEGKNHHWTKQKWLHQKHCQIWILVLFTADSWSLQTARSKKHLKKHSALLSFGKVWTKNNNTKNCLNKKKLMSMHANTVNHPHLNFQNHVVVGAAAGSDWGKRQACGERVEDWQ